LWLFHWFVHYGWYLPVLGVFITGGSTGLNTILSCHFGNRTLAVLLLNHMHSIRRLTHSLVMRRHYDLDTQAM